MKNFFTIFIAIIIIFSVLFYLQSAMFRMVYINKTLNIVDQLSFVNEATAFKETGYIQNLFWKSRNRMPLYPFLLSFFVDNNLRQTFLNVKLFSINFSFVILGILLIIFRRFLSLSLSVNLWLGTAFTVFIFRSSYIEVDSLNYLLFFLSFVLLNLMLKQPSYKIAYFSGITLALTFYTKISVLLLIYIYIIITFIQWLVMLINKNKNIKQNVINNLIMFFTFIILLSPYISYSKKVFGDYFYNANTSVYMWYDSWNQVIQDPQYPEGFQDNTYHNLPKDYFNRYLKTHTIGQITTRISDGAQALYKLAFKYHQRKFYRYSFIVVFLLITLCCSLVVWPQKVLQITVHNFWRASFSFLAIFSYF